MKKLKSDCFTILNANGQPVVFRTSNVLLNKLKFSIINKTDGPLSLNGSTDGSQSSFNFNFESMLGASVVENMTLSLPLNWAKILHPGGAAPSWTIFPTQNTVLQQNEEVSFELTNITCPDTAPGNFLISYVNIPDYGTSVFPAAKHLDVINSPDPAKNVLPLKDAYTRVVHPIQGQVGLSEHFVSGRMVEASETLPVYITYDQSAIIQNGFTYLLTNTSKNPLVPLSPQAGLQDNGDQPVLYLSFLFGEHDYDITTQALADNNISIDISSGTPWTVSRHTDGTSYWKCTPGDPQVMQPYETVSFRINKLITPLNVPADTISIMYIQFNNVPGFNDGVYNLILEKLAARAELKLLEADRYNIYETENIKIQWESSLAKRVTIEYYLKDGRRVFLDSQLGDIKLDGKDFWLPVLPTLTNTVITAVAYDDRGSNTKQIHVVVNEPPQAEIIFFRRAWSMAGERGRREIPLEWETRFAKKIVIVPRYGSSEEFPPSVTRAAFPWMDLQGESFTMLAYSANEKFPDPVSRTVDV